MAMHPESASDERAASKLSACHRVFARARGGMVDKWNSARMDVPDCAIKGSSALQRVLLRALCYKVAGQLDSKFLVVH